MPELKRLSVRHDSIIAWLIANPHLPLSACAAEFEVTQSWLSSIIHSDLFQAKLAERQDEVFGEVALTVKDRITNLAHESLKRVTEKVMVENDVEKLIGASELALKALGFGGQARQPGASTEVTVNVVSKDVLAAARRKMEERDITPSAPQLEGQTPIAIPASISSAEGVTE